MATAPASHTQLSPTPNMRGIVKTKEAMELAHSAGFEGSLKYLDFYTWKMKMGKICIVIDTANVM